jgi:hypothetical protein
MTRLGEADHPGRKFQSGCFFLGVLGSGVVEGAGPGARAQKTRVESARINNRYVVKCCVRLHTTYTASESAIFTVLVLLRHPLGLLPLASCVLASRLPAGLPCKNIGSEPATLNAATLDSFAFRPKKPQTPPNERSVLERRRGARPDQGVCESLIVPAARTRADVVARVPSCSQGCGGARNHFGQGQHCDGSVRPDAAPCRCRRTRRFVRALSRTSRASQQLCWDGR